MAEPTVQPSGEPTPRLRARDRIKGRMKPAGGVAPLLHVAFQLALPVVVFVLSSVSIGSWLPMLVIFLSKWRIFAVRPRFWAANLRANSVDVMVGVSVVLFMANAPSSSVRLLWAVAYGVWLLFIKPKSGNFGASIQSGIAQLAALSALFVAWPNAPQLGLVAVVGFVCYLSARHFFDSYSEPYAKLLSYIWGYFAAASAWVLGHLLIVYPDGDGKIAHPVLLLSVIGYTLAAVYYLEHYDRLSLLLKRELLYICAGAVIILLISLYYEGANLIV